MQSHENKRRRVTTEEPQYIDIILETVNQSQPNATHESNPRDLDPVQVNYQIHFHILSPLINETTDHNLVYDNATGMFNIIRQFDISFVFSLFNILFNKKNVIDRNDLEKIITARYRTKAVKEECSICMEEFRANQKIRILDCKHFFHCKCVDTWFLDYDDRCPVCRVTVGKEEKIA